MIQATAETGSSSGASTQFLVELEHACALFGLYGSEHPAFRKRAELTASCAADPISVGVSPKGFTADSTAIAEDALLPLARRLVGLGVVGLTVSQGVGADEIRGLIEALHDSERQHLSGQAVGASVAKATGGRINALTVRLDNLRYVAGTGGAGSEDDTAATWRELFARACGSAGNGAGSGGATAPLDAARWFETEARRVQSSEGWTDVLEAWVGELRELESQTSGEGFTSPDPNSPPAPFASNASAPREAGDESRLDGMAMFLRSLNPHLRQKLIGGMLGHSRAPERVVQALARRLPITVVLGAFSVLDRKTGEPSPAALALLRKMYQQLTGSRLPDDPPPRSDAELAEISASLQHLLESDQERRFVPEEYLARREELSRRSVECEGGSGMATLPSDEETRRRAAEVALQILSGKEAAAEHLVSGLEYVRARIGDWVRSGDFALAGRAIGLAEPLRGAGNKEVSDAAAAVAAAGYDLEALREGLSRATGDNAAEGIIQMLQYADGPTLGRVLGAASLAPAGAGERVLIEAVGGLLARGDEASIAGLFRSVRDKTPRVVLLVLGTMPPPEALRAVQAILPHAAPAVRRGIIQTIFDRNVAWPAEMTLRLLEDEDPAVRRLAMMRLARDADLGAVARVLEQASKPGPLPVDVALGLAELLRPHRRDAAVHDAYRHWIWSSRRWGTFLFMSVGGKGKRAA